MDRLRCSLAFGCLFLFACGDDSTVTHADQLGVGAECTADEQCVHEDRDGGIHTRCLTTFKGGYCGIEDCVSSDDCPIGSACVAHDDGSNYCFRICRDKPECNANRSPENESNCSSSVTFVDVDAGSKACVPPSGS